MALFVSSVSMFVSCKDYDEDMYVEFTSLQTHLQNQVNDLDAWKKGVQAAMDKMAGTTDANLEAAVNAAIKNANKADSAWVADSIANMLSYIEQAKAAARVADSLAREALKKAGTGGGGTGGSSCDCEGLEELKTRVGNLEGFKNILPEEWTNLTSQAAQAWTTAQANAKSLETQQANITQLLADMAKTASQEELTALQTQQAELKQAQTAAEQKAEALQTTLTELSGMAAVQFDSLATEMGSMKNLLNTSVKTVEDKLQAQITELREDLDAVKAKLNNLLDDVLNKMITGIIAQASENPVVGYLNTPLGVTSNILAVYYGTTENKYEFPATAQTYYATGENYGLWTARNLEIIGDLNAVEGYFKGNAGDKLVTEDGKEGNAGTLYVTVNPSNVDFTGKVLKLKDSQDNDASATLSPLEATDKVLNFGYTRAASNGFYAAKATINAEDVENAKLNVSFADFKNDAIDMLKERSKSSVIEMGATIAKNLKDVATAYAVQGEWEDATTGTKHNVYSNYGVAAVAVKPFSFNFAQDFSVNGKLPGIGRLQKVIGNMVDKIKIDLNLPDFSGMDLTFDEVTVDKSKFISLNVKLTLRVDGNDKITVVGSNDKLYTVKVDEGKVVEILDGTTPVAFEYTTDENGEPYFYLEDVRLKSEKMNGKWFLTCYYYFGEAMESIVDDLVTDFNNAIPDDLANLLEEVKKLSEINSSIDKAKDNIKEQINDYITRINNKLSKWINRAPAMLHLTMVATDGKGNLAGMLSQAENLPTKASGALTLVPTTYSLEMLAPAYKKFIAVTDVVGVDLNTAKELAAKANKGYNMNKVVDSNVTCTLEGEKGYTYEVTYTAIDYAGKVAIRKYYVKF